MMRAIDLIYHLPLVLHFSVGFSQTLLFDGIEIPVELDRDEFEKELLVVTQTRCSGTLLFRLHVLKMMIMKMK